MPAKPVRPDYTARPGEAVRVYSEDGRSLEIGVGRVAIAPADIDFVTAVVEDLRLLADAPEGERVLLEGDRLGRPVRIVKPDAPTAPPNAWTIPDDLAAATAAGVLLGRAGAGTGTGCGSTIAYDPADWPRPGEPRSPSSMEVLLMMLRQANLNARGGSDPSKPQWGTETEGPR